MEEDDNIVSCDRPNDELQETVIINAESEELPESGSSTECFNQRKVSPRYIDDINISEPKNISDDDKYQLTQNREPPSTSKFHSEKYANKNHKSGYMNRYCCMYRFKTFDFITYSERSDGLYCLARVLFPDTAHRRPKKIVSECYNNWKDAIMDLKSHSAPD